MRWTAPRPTYVRAYFPTAQPRSVALSVLLGGVWLSLKWSLIRNSKHVSSAGTPGSTATTCARVANSRRVSGCAYAAAASLRMGCGCTERHCSTTFQSNRAARRGLDRRTGLGSVGGRAAIRETETTAYRWVYGEGTACPVSLLIATATMR